MLGTSLETTERVIEDRRRQVLRDVASRTAEARCEDEVWRVSTDTLREHRMTIPFAYLYACRPAERRAYLVGPSVEPDALDPRWSITRSRISGDSTSHCRGRDRGRTWAARTGAAEPHWPVPPEKAAVVPIRLREAATWRGSSFWESIRAERSMIHTANSSVGSPNRWLSGWLALGPTSRSGSARTHWPKSIAPRPHSSATSATSSARRCN